MNKAILSVLILAAVALGIFLIIYGGMDDSPGAQMLGLVVALVGIVAGVRARRR